MKDDLALAADFTDGGNVLDHTDFVIHMHDADQHGVIAQRRLEFLQVQQAIWLRVQVRDFIALALQLAAGIQYRLVFRLQGDDVFAFLLVEVCSTLDGKVVGLGRTGCPDDFLRVCIDQLRHV